MLIHGTGDFYSVEILLCCCISLLVGIELDERSVPLAGYRHPERAVYLLGSETDGLPQEALEHCADVVQIPGEFSLNVSVAESIVLYDRLLKTEVLEYDLYVLRPVLENFANLAV